MNEQNLQKLKGLMYRLVRFNQNNDLGVIYNCNISQDISASKDEYSVVISFINVTASLPNSTLMTDKYIARTNQEVEELFNLLVPIKEVDKYQNELRGLSGIVVLETQQILADLKTITDCSAAVSKIVNIDQLFGQTNNLIIDSDSGTIVSMVLDSLEGSGKDSISQAELSYTLGVVANEILQNLHVNLDDPDEVEKLKKRLEFKFIESLPDNISAADLHLNMEAVVDSMKTMKGE